MKYQVTYETDFGPYTLNRYVSSWDEAVEHLKSQPFADYTYGIKLKKLS